MSLEFGATLALNLGIVAAEVHAMAGVRAELGPGDGVSLTGFVRIGGSVDLLGLVSVTVELVVSLRYEPSPANALVGSASVVVEIDLTLYSDSIELNSGEWRVEGGDVLELGAGQADLEAPRGHDGVDAVIMSADMAPSKRGDGPIEGTRSCRIGRARGQSWCPSGLAEVACPRPGIPYAGGGCPSAREPVGATRVDDSLGEAEGDGLPRRAIRAAPGVDDLPALHRLPSGEAREDHLGPRGSFTGGRIGTAEGQANGDHVPVRDHRLDRHSDVGELFVQAREGPLHSLATVTDAWRFGVKLMLCREELVGRVQLLLVDHMLHDSAHGVRVLGGFH